MLRHLQAVIMGRHPLRRLISVLLTLSMILMPVEPGFSQIYTTVTTEITVAIPVSYTSTQLIGISSSTTTYPVREGILSTSLAHDGTPNQCPVTWFSFYAEPGQILTGTVNADHPKTLVTFILSAQQFNIWRAKENYYCDPTYTGKVSVAWEAGYYDSPITVAEIHLTPTIAGTYWLVIETVSAVRVTATVNLFASYSRTSITLFYSTSLFTGMYSVTRTTTSLVQSITAGAPAAISSIGVGVMIGLVFSFPIVLYRHKRTGRKRKGAIRRHAR